MSFKNRLTELKQIVDVAMRSYLNGIAEVSQEPGLRELTQAMTYSVESGGHRIRPILSCLTAEAFSKPIEDVLGFGCAVELIHTYSLVHDDLPCMDDDDFRRGKPSNHKVFGEALAVLAGDAMSTEAFSILAKTYKSDPQLALDLIAELARASGAEGMAGGQAVDLVFRNKPLQEEEIRTLHARKTGMLLRASVLGAARVCNATTAQVDRLDRYAQALGLTFQIADDIMDDTKTDEPSFVKTLGLDKAKATCEELVNTAHEAVEEFGAKGQGLKELASYVYERAL